MSAMFHVFPTEYPTPHRSSRQFLLHAQSCALPPEVDERQVKLVTKSPILKSCLLSRLNATRTESVGVMRGEYAMMPDGLLLLNPQGAWFSINYPFDNQLAGGNAFEKINSNGTRGTRDVALREWDALPLLDNALIMSSIWQNYYHYTFDLLPKMRIAEPLGYAYAIVPHELMAQKYQRSLLVAALGDRQVVPANLLRVRDPIIAECLQTRESLSWLRDIMGIDAPAGRKRYFVRRSQAKARFGNNVAATPELLALLDRYGFETVDFGSGELTVAEQVEKLSGAEIILSPHGAGLTNLAYLNAPLTVIEVFSSSVLSATFMEIAIQLGFRYYGLLQEWVDEQGDIPVDIEELEAILRETLG